MACTKTNTLNSSKHAEQQDVTNIQNKLFVCVLFPIDILDINKDLKMIHVYS